MKSKTPLALMEQSIMVLVFALAAALCLRVFVWCDNTSKRDEARDYASLRAQSAAEQIKHAGKSGGSAEEVLAAAAQNLGTSSSGGTFELQYGKDWSVSDGKDAAYVLRAAAVDTGIAGLNKAHITVTAAGKSDVIFEIDIAWQGGRSA